jgi:hypothetical protein
MSRRLSEILKEKLNFPRAYRATRLEVAHWVLVHPETFEVLLNFCYSPEKELSYKATWILEYACKEDLSMLYPYFDLFMEQLPTVKLDQAARPMAKICELICIRYYKQQNVEIQEYFSNTHKEQMIAVCFDWQITPQKVACKVYGMSALFFLGTEQDWIHPALETMIHQNIAQAQPAYKARGKHSLKAISRFRKKIR